MPRTLVYKTINVGPQFRQEEREVQLSSVQFSVPKRGSDENTLGAERRWHHRARSDRCHLAAEEREVRRRARPQPLANSPVFIRTTILRARGVAKSSPLVQPLL